MPQQILNLPVGYAATFTTDNQTSGTYQQYDSVYTGYVPVTLNVSTTYTIGPFNTPTNFLFITSGNAIDIATAMSGVFTAVDDAGKRPVIDTVVAYAASGAIAVPTVPTIAKITKSSAIAVMTLAAPAAVSDGCILTIVSSTAKAHTVTATALINDGVTGEAKTTATFAAFVGASITLMAMDQMWTVVASSNVTVA